MRKNLLLSVLMFLFGTLLNVSAVNLYADLDASSHAGKNGSYDPSTHVYTWTASNNSRVLLSGLSGDLSAYENLVIDFTMGGDYTSGANIRIDIIANGNTYAGTNAAGKFYSDGVKTISLNKLVTNADDLKYVTEVRVNTNSASGTATINSVYITEPEKYFSLEFDASGVCTVPLDMLVAKTATYDTTTGTLTSEGSGSIALKLPSEGIDMKEVGQVVMEVSGDELVANVLMTNGSKSKRWYSSKYTQKFVNQADQTDITDVTASPITGYTWNLSSTAGTMTINSVKIYKADSGTTGIDRVEAGATNSTAKGYYSINGQHFNSQPSKAGIYIYNGKKFIVR